MKMSIPLVISNEDAQTMVEYGVLVALISAAVIFLLIALGQNLNLLFQTTDADLQNAQNSIPGLP